ncbi:hypothetical protein KAR91_69570 [Candidatus Pacearchaeota archaeon]|nr:hypothetical protein [Candidatus Pacearchaeota archaeon]
MDKKRISELDDLISNSLEGCDDSSDSPNVDTGREIERILGAGTLTAKMEDDEKMKEINRLVMEFLKD